MAKWWQFFLAIFQFCSLVCSLIIGSPEVAARERRVTNARMAREAGGMTRQRASGGIVTDKEAREEEEEHWAHSHRMLQRQKQAHMWSLDEKRPTSVT